MSNRSLKIELHKADPKCYWCKRETKLTNVKHIRGTPDPLMATIDHLISRLDPRRWVKKQEGEVRKVLACFECNNSRSQTEINSLSKEELYLRGQGFSLNPKGKPVIERPAETLDEVVERIDNHVKAKVQHVRQHVNRMFVAVEEIDNHLESAKEFQTKLQSFLEESDRFIETRLPLFRERTETAVKQIESVLEKKISGS